MSVKKLLVLTAGLAVMGATAAMAGGPDHMAMPAQPAFENSVYLEGHVGYAQSDWTDSNTNGFMGNSAVSVFAPNSNGNGGFTGGVDLGYNFSQNLALEAGWFYLPKVSGPGTGVTVGGASATSAISGTVRSWVAYVAAKLSVALMDNFDLFGKVGVAYRGLNYSVPSTVTTSSTGNGHYWLPFFATGLEYTMGSWLFGAQYAYITGNTNVNNANTAFGAPNAAPSASLYTGFIGYKFNV